MGKKSIVAVALWLTISGTGVPAIAVAQDATIEEVKVTARRREESLQDVPLSVTAYPGDALERVGTQDIIAIGQTTPNMTLEVSRGTNSTLTAFIRGVGQQDPVAGFEAGVGLYLDDVYLNRPQAAVLDIYDVERIEVLRGPQGTLYGRNTIGGAIKYVTKKLSSVPEANTRFSVGTDNQLDVVVSGSYPLTNSLRIGGAIARLSHDGYGTNRNLSGVENYHKDVTAGRISVEWDPTDFVSLRLMADRTEDDSDPRQGHRLTVGNVSGAPILSDVFDTRAGLNNPEQSVEADGITFDAQWDINPKWMVKLILATRDDESFSPIDFDSLPAADLDVPVVYRNDQDSVELQVSYTGDRLSGIVGYYQLDANAFNAFDVILGTTGDLIGLPGLNAFTLGDVDTDTWSVFADFTYELTDTIAVSIGGRYTTDERSSRIVRELMIGGTSSFFGGDATTIATTSDFNGTKEWSEFTPRASVAWHMTPQQNLYLTYSEGFKGGSFDPRGQTSAAPDLNGDGVVDDNDIFEFMMFRPESVESIELGLKSGWLNNRINTSIALFNADYKDVQIPGSVGVDTNGDGISDSFTGITSNAADADVRGVEFEGTARANEYLTASWTLGYIDAEFNEFIDAFGVDVADEREFQNTPDVTASVTLAWEMPVNWFSMSGSAAVIGTWSYRGDASQFEVPTPQLDQDAFSLLDVSFVWETDDGKWRAGVHGKNLADKEYKVAGYFFPNLGLEGSITAFYGNPRTVTTTVERRF